MQMYCTKKLNTTELHMQWLFGTPLEGTCIAHFENHWSRWRRKRDLYDSWHHTCIFFLNHSSSHGLQVCWKQSQLSLGKMKASPWNGCQHIAGHAKKNSHSQSHLGTIWCVQFTYHACFRNVGGNRISWRNPRGESMQSPHRKARAWIWTHKLFRNDIVNKKRGGEGNQAHFSDNV